MCGCYIMAEILALYPYLEPDDIAQALSCAAWRAAEVDTLIGSA